MKRSIFCRRFLPLLLILAVLAAAVGWEVYRSSRTLSCSHYEIRSEKLTQGVRIVQLSDLHNASFGEENQVLLDLVRTQQPDLIFCTGDFLTGNEPETATALALVQKLCAIAPVYFSLGNHEILYEEACGTDVTALFSQAGATVLDFAYEDIDLNGQALRVGGIYGYCLSPTYIKTGEANPAEIAFLSDFQKTDACTLLLCHMPVCWIENDNLDVWQIDCIFAGHAHGGQVTLPLIGGLYAPDQGFFPGVLEGTFSSKDGSSTLILSRGLGSSIAIPRFGNVPEVVTVDLIPAET